MPVCLFHRIIAVVIIVSMSGPACAQSGDSTSAYYISYERQISGRFYFSRKFTSLLLRNRDNDILLRYKPNTTLNMGVGATYKWATLNLAYGFGFLNPDHGRGKTRYLDLQFHSYGRKVTVDVLGQFYRGFYLSPKGQATEPNEYYRRPDLRVRAAGASVQYIFNHKRFSYRASFLQNEWQKRSAGTFLIGVELFAGNVAADSSLIPTAVNATDVDIRRVRFIEFGPNAGYAYTYVYKEHFFLTGAGSLSLDVGFNTLINDERKSRATGINPNTLFRFSGGYNSDVWAVSMLYTSSAMRLASRNLEAGTLLRTGNVRLIFTYRFRPGKKVREYLKVIDEADPANR